MTCRRDRFGAAAAMAARGVARAGDAGRDARGAAPRTPPRGSPAPPRRRSSRTTSAPSSTSTAGTSRPRASSTCSTAASEFEKLVNLDGPAREVIRSNGEVRCYYPDAKVVRVEPRTFRNAFPSLSPQQQAALADYYDFRMAERGRVAGIETQAWVFEPKDGLRYGHKFWADAGVRAPRQGAHLRRAERGRRAVRVHRDLDRRQDRSRDGEADLARGAAGLAGAPVRAGRRRSEGDRLDGLAPAAGVPQDRRWLPAAARQARGRASRVLGRPRRGLGVHRAGRRRAASDRVVARRAASTSSSGSRTTIW